MAFVALALLARAAGAHPFWVEPENFHPAVGTQVPLRLRVGMDFKGEPVLYAPEQFERYVYAGPDGEHDITGTLGDDPAGSVPITRAGIYTVGYHSKPFEITFDSFAKFEEYLKLEGLERNLALAQRRFKIRKTILERYERCAKSLIRAGDGAAPVGRVLGFPIELVAETSPYNGEHEMRVHLLYDGKPLANALVIAFSRKAPLDVQRVRTDKDGRATVKLDKPGVWLLNAVHMVATSFLSRADWRSFWASLTFERP